MNLTTTLRWGRSGGWGLVGITAMILAAGVVIILVNAADPIDGLRRLIRVTARSSVTLFLLAFTASAAFHFWPNAWTRWQRQNRRYLGVSFALSHFVHLAAILALRDLAPEQLADTALITWIGGGLAYVFIALMTATSFDRTARLIGPRAWTVLHTAGAYYVWLIFAQSYIARAAMAPQYIPVALAVIAALALRIAAHVSKLRAAQPATAG